ncbi:MAG: hypothetical protein LBP88_05060 [Treponema sp.]|jgi:hypothetical protein|nr:hypothetical protein [Treponema sp.]
MKRRILGLGLVLVLGLVLSGCKTDTDDSGASNTGGNNDEGGNPFVGTWTGTATFDGDSASATITVTSTRWTFVCREADLEETGTYTRSGNRATFKQSNGSTFGTASISGGTLTVTLTSSDIYEGGQGTFHK